MLCKPLLYLRPSGEKIDNAVHLREAQNFSSWDVAYEGGSHKWDKVVFTDTFHLTTMDNHLVVLHLVIDSRYTRKVIIVKAVEDFFHEHVGNSLGCIFEGVIMNV